MDSCAFKPQKPLTNFMTEKSLEVKLLELFLLAINNNYFKLLEIQLLSVKRSLQQVILQFILGTTNWTFKILNRSNNNLSKYSNKLCYQLNRYLKVFHFSLMSCKEIFNFQKYLNLHSIYQLKEQHYQAKTQLLNEVALFLHLTCNLVTQ